MSRIFCAAVLLVPWNYWLGTCVLAVCVSNLP